VITVRWLSDHKLYESDPEEEVWVLPLSEQDQLAIHRLVALYGYVTDERRYARMEEVFTVDAVYGVTERGTGLHRGVEQIRSLWKSTDDLAAGAATARG
jgi:SnoaL-like domain